MNTYKRKFDRNLEHIPQVYTKEVLVDDGTSIMQVSLDKPFESPFVGLDAASFSISNQLKSGVPLKPIKPHSLSDNINGIDSASEMIDKVSV